VKLIDIEIQSANGNDVEGEGVGQGINAKFRRADAEVCVTCTRISRPLIYQIDRAFQAQSWGILKCFW
jgi:hypothetical protein